MTKLLEIKFECIVFKGKNPKIKIEIALTSFYVG
jgi:hypothetical protein